MAEEIDDYGPSKSHKFFPFRRSHSKSQAGYHRLGKTDSFAQDRHNDGEDGCSGIAQGHSMRKSVYQRHKGEESTSDDNSRNASNLQKQKCVSKERAYPIYGSKRRG